jgi:hypothetical protein
MSSVETVYKLLLQKNQGIYYAFILDSVAVICKAARLLNWMTENNFLVTCKRWGNQIQGDRNDTEQFLKHDLFVKKINYIEIRKNTAPEELRNPLCLFPSDFVAAICKAACLLNWMTEKNFLVTRKR